ncbi:MAG: biotin--[acetyl-CoA-carboxylase] ligase [Nitratireductor sp.]
MEETASTNADCLEAARAGEAGNLWIRAARQTAGKGSRGRDWVSVDGNMYASVLLVDPGEREKLAGLTFVTALAVREAIAEIAREAHAVRDISLKWPNDVLVSGRKVSGILLECHEFEGKTFVIAGIGINCANHPQDTLHRATDLQSEGMFATPEMVFERLARQYGELLLVWNRGEGFASIREKWLSEASGLGERIYVKMPGREVSGIFETIDPDGYMKLELDDGSLVRISVGDIFFNQANHTGN